MSEPLEPSELDVETQIGAAPACGPLMCGELGEVCGPACTAPACNCLKVAQVMALRPDAPLLFITSHSVQPEWERRQGMRMSKGWHWSSWQPCTESEAQRVTGLHSWQVRQTGQCGACSGTGRMPYGVPAVEAQGWYFKRLMPSGTIVATEPDGTQHMVQGGDLNKPSARTLLEAMMRDLTRPVGVAGGHVETFPPADADDAARRNDDLIRLGRSAGK